MSKPKQQENGYSNVFWNSVTPFTGGGKTLVGTASFVAIETAIGQLVRRTMGLGYAVRDSATIHTLSVPFLGSLNFGENDTDFKFDKKDDVSISDQAQIGAKHIPAALVGYTANEMIKNGIRVPRYATKDVMALMIGKLISRPLTAYVFTSLPEDMQIGLQTLNDLNNQARTVVQESDEAEEEDER